MLKFSLIFCLLVPFWSCSSKNEHPGDQVNVNDGTPNDVQPDVLADFSDILKDLMDTSTPPPSACGVPPAAGVSRVLSACVMSQAQDNYRSEQEGDWVLENANARYVIRAGNAEGLMIMGTGAGGVVDAIPVVDGAYRFDLDHLLELAPIPGFRTFKDPVFTTGVDPQTSAAWVRVEGSVVPIAIIDEVLSNLGTGGNASVTWTLPPDTARLEIDMELRADETSLAAPTLWLGFFHSGLMDTYVQGQGVVSEAGGSTLMLGAISPEVSIGLTSTDTLLLFGPTGLVLTKIPGEESSEDDVVVFRGSATFVVSNGDLANVNQQLPTADKSPAAVQLEVSNLPEGWTEPPYQLQIEQLDKDGVLIQRVAVRQNPIEVFLSPGEHDVRLAWRGGPTSAKTSLVVAGDGSSSLTLAAPDVGVLSIETSVENIRVPARVLVYQESGEVQRYATRSDEALLALVKPGTHRLVATRGHEFEVFDESIAPVAAGQTVETSITLTRSVDTSGWIACDFHLHSEYSTDSQNPLARRILEVSAEGVEFAVSSDHDFISNYAPLRDKLGLADHLAVAMGTEMSHPTLTHCVSWPLEQDPLLSGMGTPRWDGKEPEELFTLLGMGNPERVLQLNHPRDSGSYFTQTKYNPDTGEAEADPTSLGFPEGTQLAGFNFDAMEVFNGKREEDIDQVWTDWLSLVAQGIGPAPTGTSDSHSSGGYPGAARTYVWVGEGADNIQNINKEKVRDGIMSHQTLVVGGAFVEAWLVGEDETRSAVGLLHTQATSTAKIRVRIQAPTWMPADRIRIYKNRAVAVDEQIPVPHGAGAPVVRLDKIYEIDVDADTFFAVRVDSEDVPRPYLNTLPISMTGALFLDTNADLLFTPPGL